MKKKSQFVVLLTAFVLSMTFQSCEEESHVDEVVNEVVEEVVISQEDSLRNLLPESTSYINDFEGLFSDEQKELLNEKIALHEGLTANEIDIVTTANFSPYENIEDYSLEIFNKWGIGKKDKDNGVLITVSKENRIVRITTGTGIEVFLTDSMTTIINEKVMIPFFKEDDYYGGVNAGLDAIIEEIK